MNEIIKFEAGKSYRLYFACNTDTPSIIKVVKRSAKTITLIDDLGTVRNCRVIVWDGSELVRPFGRYSMSPVLRAKNLAA